MTFWNIYLRLFGRRAWVRFHTTLLKFALRGLGFQNWWSPRVSGEAWVLEQVGATFPTPCLLDVGGNVGTYATLARRLIPQARIISLEPNPASHTALALAASEHGFTAIHTAAGSGHGTAPLYFRADQPTSTHASLLDGVNGADDKTVHIKVPLTTLDALLPTLGVQHVHLLKVDTEGAELDVITGASATIAAGAVDWVQFEFNTMNIAARTYFEDFARALPGYRFFRLLPRGLVELDGSTWSLPNLFVYQNLLAVRPGAPLPFPFRH